jgi:hypothetical protein
MGRRLSQGRNHLAAVLSKNYQRKYPEGKEQQYEFNFLVHYGFLIESPQIRRSVSPSHAGRTHSRHNSFCFLDF